MPHSTAVNRSFQQRGDRAEHLLQLAQHASRRSAARLRREVVIDHIALATSIAHRYDHRGLEREDLEQVALLGLVQAVRRYRTGHGSGFLAFAMPTITGELKRHFRDHGWAVRPPRQLQEQSLEVRARSESLAQELGRDPTEEEVARSLGLEVEEVRNAQAVDAQYIARSMDAPLDRDDSVSLCDMLGESQTDLDRVETFETLRPLLRRLTPRDRLIVRLRFVDNLTQRQIGERIGVSQMQVSRLLADILRRLRQAIGADFDDVSTAS